VRQTFKVTYFDGSVVESVAGLGDQVAFEREFDKSIAELASNFRITDICWLAWHGLRRKSPQTQEFDAWVETVETVEVVDDGDIVPLETAAPTG